MGRSRIFNRPGYCFEGLGRIVDPDISRLHSQVFFFCFGFLRINELRKLLIDAIFTLRIRDIMNFFNSHSFYPTLTILKSFYSLEFIDPRKTSWSLLIVNNIELFHWMLSIIIRSKLTDWSFRFRLSHGYLFFVFMLKMMVLFFKGLIIVVIFLLFCVFTILDFFDWVIQSTFNAFHIVQMGSLLSLLHFIQYFDLLCRQHSIITNTSSPVMLLVWVSQRIVKLYLSSDFTRSVRWLSEYHWMKFLSAEGISSACINLLWLIKFIPK